MADEHEMRCTAGKTSSTNEVRFRSVPASARAAVLCPSVRLVAFLLLLPLQNLDARSLLVLRLISDDRSRERSESGRRLQRS